MSPNGSDASAADDAGRRDGGGALNACGPASSVKKMFPWNLLRAAAAGVSLSAVAAAFLGAGGVFRYLPHVQLMPALARFLATFSVGALATVLTILLSVLLFGRFYCAAICPLGVLQDAVGLFRGRRGRAAPNLRRVRYAAAAAVFGAMACGWCVPALLLDPYSLFGRIAGRTAGGAVLLAVMIPLVLWRKRFFCSVICPAGTLLGLPASRSLFRLRVTDACVGCGLCERACPSGCIDHAGGTVDDGRCVRCLNCLSVCPRRAVVFGPHRGTSPGTDATRRSILVNGGILLAGLAAGTAIARTGMFRLPVAGDEPGILPPGADSMDRFAARCTACQLCVANCPGGVLTAAPYGVGPVSVDLTRGSCRYDCNRCSQICPGGAIRALPLDIKRRTKIAEARFNPRNCLVFQRGVRCGRCADACPTGAVTLRSTGAPRLNTDLCIGCGACQAACPAAPKAMTVRGIEKQVLIAGGGPASS